MIRTLTTAVCVFAASLVYTVGAAAQLSNDLLDKAPPHVDQALRGRVSFFYQAHVDGKFRLADTVVHEDSKDAFFVADKNRCKSFDIIKIEYEEEFTKARVVTAVGTDFFMPGPGKLDVTIPLTTLWKLDAGEWWWYVLPRGEEGVETPFGTMKPGAEGDSSSPYHRLQNMPGVEQIGRNIRVNKTELTLSCSSPSSDEVVISNGMPGAITIQYSVDEIEGVTATLDKKELPGGEDAHLKVSCEPREELAGKRLSGTIAISPTGHQIPLTITISAK